MSSLASLSRVSSRPRFTRSIYWRILLRFTVSVLLHFAYTAHPLITCFTGSRGTKDNGEGSSEAVNEKGPKIAHYDEVLESRPHISIIIDYLLGGVGPLIPRRALNALSKPLVFCFLDRPVVRLNISFHSGPLILVVRLGPLQM